MGVRRHLLGVSLSFHLSGIKLRLSGLWGKVYFNPLSHLIGP